MDKQAKTPAGWLYVLFDADAELCKIGCTARDGRKRQRAIMASHGHSLLNLLNAQVADRFAAERQCHQHFRSHRRNGEWFAVRPDDVLLYVHKEIEHTAIDFEPPINVLMAINQARLRQPVQERLTFVTCTPPRVAFVNGELVAHIDSITITKS